MQQPVQGEHAPLGRFRVRQRPGLTSRDTAGDDDVTEKGYGLRATGYWHAAARTLKPEAWSLKPGWERQHVGGMVRAAVCPVERADARVGHDGDGDFAPGARRRHARKPPSEAWRREGPAPSIHDRDDEVRGPLAVGWHDQDVRGTLPDWNASYALTICCTSL